MEIELEFISSQLLAQREGKEKVDFILDKVKEDKILVIEESLTTNEESQLIEQTMRQIDNKFPGIEVSSLGGRKGLKGKLIKLLGGSTGVTVVGPSRLIKKVKKNPEHISVLAERKKLKEENEKDKEKEEGEDKKDKDEEDKKDKN